MSDSTPIIDGREQTVVYVTENRRDAEELAAMWGYGIVVRKRFRTTLKGKASFKQFVVCPHHMKYQ